MRIAYILDTYPALSETFIAREIVALRRSGFDIEIFAIRAGEGATPIRVSPLLRAAKAIAPHRQTQVWKTIGAHWWNELPAQGIAHIHAGFASYPASLAWGAAQAAHLSWSFSGHARDLWVEGHELKAKLDVAHFATSCTRAGVEWLKETNAHGEVLYMPHGLELEKYPFAPRSRKSGEIVRLVSVGRLVEKKGYNVLLDALAILRERRIAFSMTIVGEGDLRASLQDRVAQLRLSGCVRLASALSHEDTIAAMRSTDALVFSGLEARDGDRDGLPNVLLEAAALGTAIVTTRAGSVSDFADGETAWICAPNDATDLAHAIVAALEQSDETRRKGFAARARVEKDFDMMRNIAPLALAFERVLHSSQSTP